jgi:methanol metabolism-related c-type cytochrome
MGLSKISHLGLYSGLTLAGALGCFSFTALADYNDFRFSPTTPYYSEDGKVDFGTYNGFRRYHSECHVCHGPAGLGSSYAPALIKSVEVIPYEEFIQVIVNGRQGANQSVMPGFAGNMNVTPYMNDIYAYLRARADGVIGPARPDKFPKAKASTRRFYRCLPWPWSLAVIACWRQ